MGHMYNRRYEKSNLTNEKNIPDSYPQGQESDIPTLMLSFGAFHVWCLPYVYGRRRQRKSFEASCSEAAARWYGESRPIRRRIIKHRKMIR